MNVCLLQLKAQSVAVVVAAEGKPPLRSFPLLLIASVVFVVFFPWTLFEPSRYVFWWYWYHSTNTECNTAAYLNNTCLLHTYILSHPPPPCRQPPNPHPQPASHPWLYRLVWSSLNFPSPNSICQLRAHWMVLCLLCPTTRNNHIASDNSAPGRQPTTSQSVHCTYLVTTSEWAKTLRICRGGCRCYGASIAFVHSQSPTNQPANHFADKS